MGTFMSDIDGQCMYFLCTNFYFEQTMTIDPASSRASDLAEI
jgi:hypothetical protein